MVGRAMDLKLPLALVLVTGGAVGLMLPPMDGAADPPRVVGTAAAAAGRNTATSQTDAFAEDLVLPRAPDGHFYAEVEIDGQRVTMLVDTGASVVALTGADAEQLGLTWDPATLAPVAQGAGGPVEGVNVTIPEMALGDHVARQVPALIIPDGLSISLLGQSFLATLGQVQMREGEMVLGNVVD